MFLQLMRSGLNWYQIVNKACYILKFVSFTWKRDVYVNKIKIVFFDM